MHTIQTSYFINERTTALLPAKQIEYETIVWEGDKQIYVKNPAIELIKASTLRYGASYEGRRESVMHMTGFKRKVPIPISTDKKIYTFPTHSPNDHNCIWIFHSHIQDTLPLPAEVYSNKKSMILFSNQMQLPLELSHYMLDKQIKRTSVCKFIFSDYVTEDAPLAYYK